MASNKVPSEERPGYVYLLHSKVHMNSKEHVYKIGKTRNFPGRFQQYPKGSLVLAVWNCKDCCRVEKEILGRFRRKYEERRDAGAEYFQGDWRNMRNDIHEILCAVETDEDVKEHRTRVVLVEDKKAFILSVFE
jgi:hypothetical protein